MNASLRQDIRRLPKTSKKPQRSLLWGFFVACVNGANPALTSGNPRTGFPSPCFAVYTVFMYSHLSDSPQPLSAPPLPLPLAGDKVCAGFPSPAEDLVAKRIDLSEVLITHPQATFLLRVSGESMKEAGIFDGDMLVVNRAMKPRHGHIVVAVVDGEFTVKYLHQRAGCTTLKPANAAYPDITPKDHQTLEVWGVVTASIKQFTR